MPRELRNIGASVRARLLDRARAERSDFQILLMRYALERLLYRLSVSPHRDRFILKGAMLFVTWVAELAAICRDREDDKFLELAVNGRADLIISGDADLLSLDTVRGIPIVTPAVFVRTGTR